MVLAFDCECFPNLFTISFTDGQEETCFVVHHTRNDLRDLLVYLSKISKEDVSLVGFNNIGYDYPLIEPLLSNWKHIWNRFKNDPDGFTNFMYKRSSDIINIDKDEWYTKYYTKSFIIPQIDLYKIHHLDNKNKRGTSLKWVEFAIDHDLLQTFDFDPHSKIDDYTEVLEYNLNDIRATYKFYEFTQKAITYREEFGALEGLDLINLSDTSIAKKLFAKYLTDSMGISYWDLKKLRTERSVIDFGDIVFDYISFQTPLFQALLNKVKSTKYIPGETSFKETVEHCGLHFDYGVGGLHAYPKKWVTGKNGKRLKDPVSIAQDYRSNDEYQIILVDVSSYYPNIAINNDLKPAHLGDAFTDVYKDFYNRRMEAKKSGQKLVEQAMKLSLNSVFGLSKEPHSFFYDSSYCFAVTLNGQLLLTMLAEQFCVNDIKLIQCNTDGIYVYARRDQIETMEKLCDDWCDMTGLKLDYDYYDRLCQRDVNNYIGIQDNGYVTKKGAFRVDKKVHEDSSMKIVPMALEQYLLYDIDYREYIKSVTDIKPFLMGLKIKGQDVLQERFLNEAKTDVVTIDHKKAVRYVVSKKGKPLYKEFSRSGNDQKVHSGFKCKIANDLSTIDRSDIDESFYIIEVEKIASLFNRQQLSLF